MSKVKSKSTIIQTEELLFKPDPGLQGRYDARILLNYFFNYEEKGDAEWTVDGFSNHLKELHKDFIDLCNEIKKVAPGAKKLKVTNEGGPLELHFNGFSEREADALFKSGIERLEIFDAYLDEVALHTRLSLERLEKANQLNVNNLKLLKTEIEKVVNSTRQKGFDEDVKQAQLYLTKLSKKIRQVKQI